MGRDPTLTLGIVGGIVLIESEPALPRCFDRPDVFHHSHPIPCLTANALARNGTSAHPSPSSENPLYLQERARPPLSSAIPHAKFTRGAPPGAKIRETTYPPSQDRYCAHVISPKKRRRSPQSPDATEPLSTGCNQKHPRCCMRTAQDKEDTVTSVESYPSVTRDKQATQTATVTAVIR